jgi:hypothetical protein
MVAIAGDALQKRLQGLAPPVMPGAFPGILPFSLSFSHQADEGKPPRRLKIAILLCGFLQCLRIFIPDIVSSASRIASRFYTLRVAKVAVNVGSKRQYFVSAQ